MVLEKTSQCSYEELKNLILDYYQVSAEEFRLKFRKTYQDDKTLKMYVIELKSYLNKWMELSKVEDFDTLKTLILKEKFIQGLPYESKKYASEQDNQGVDFEKLIEKVKNYQLTHKSSVNTLRCFKCKKTGHKESDCHWNKSKSNMTEGNWRDRSNKVSLNNIESDNENAINEKEDEIIEDPSECIFLINSKKNANESNSLKITEGKVNDMKAEVIRDSGCSAIVVNKKFVRPGSYTGKFGTLKVADGTKYRVQKAKIKIDSPYLSGIHEAYCFNTDYDLIIGNVPGAKCSCLKLDAQNDNCTKQIETEEELPPNVALYLTQKVAEKREKEKYAKKRNVKETSNNQRLENLQKNYDAPQKKKRNEKNHNNSDINSNESKQIILDDMKHKRKRKDLTRQQVSK